MTKDSIRIKIRLAPAAASVVALAVLAVVPSVALAGTASSSATATPAPTASATPTPSASATPTAAASPATARPVSLPYRCMLLGETVPTTLTWTVPQNLVAAAQAPLPAGRTLRQAAHGAVALRLSVRLSKAMIARLRLVDQRTIGGTIASRLSLGPDNLPATYKTATHKLAPDATGTQTLTATLDLSNTLIRSRDSGKVQPQQLMVAKSFTTDLMIPGFLRSNCSLSNPNASRTLLPATVRPAAISTTITGVQITAGVRDGAGAAAVGTVTETMTGWAAHQKHTLTIRGTLDKGVFVHSFRTAMTRSGITSATVQVAFAGRTATVRLRL